jgi:hypothetical protein
VFRATVSSRTPLRVPTKAGRVYLGATSTVRRSQAGTPVALKGAAVPPPCGALDHPATLPSAGAQTERPRRAPVRPTAGENHLSPPSSALPIARRPLASPPRAAHRAGVVAPAAATAGSRGAPLPTALSSPTKPQIAP